MWEVWSSDTFDRDSGPTVEGTFDTFEQGLRALWKKTLSEAVQDDGRPTFTEFSLRGQPMVFLPRDPFKNPELAVLRARMVANEGFLDDLVKVHASRIASRVTLPQLLVLTAPLPLLVQQVVAFLSKRLELDGVLSVTAEGSWAQERIVVTPRWAPPSPDAAAWSIIVSGRSGAFAVVVESGRARVEVTEAADAQVLRDALLEAGLAST